MGPALSPSPWDKSGPFCVHFNPYILGSHACGGAGAAVRPRLRGLARQHHAKHNVGVSLPADPHRGTLSFVTQSSFVLVRSTTEGIVVGNPFLLLFAVTSDGQYAGRAGGLTTCPPLISPPGYGAAGGVISEGKIT